MLIDYLTTVDKVSGRHHTSRSLGCNLKIRNYKKIEKYTHKKYLFFSNFVKMFEYFLYIEVIKVLERNWKITRESNFSRTFKTISFFSQFLSKLKPTVSFHKISWITPNVPINDLRKFAIRNFLENILPGSQTFPVWIFYAKILRNLISPIFYSLSILFYSYLIRNAYVVAYFLENFGFLESVVPGLHFISVSRILVH